MSWLYVFILVQWIVFTFEKVGLQLIFVKEDVHTVVLADIDWKVLLLPFSFVRALRQVPEVALWCHAVVIIECTDHNAVLFVRIHKI